jgi:hypothetical protein
MTGSALKTFVDSLTNDSVGETWFYNALNLAKDSIEGERDWEFVKKLDTTKTHPAGTTSTATYALPTDFGRPLRVSVGTDSTYRSLVGLENSRVLRDESGAYFIDWAGETYSFTGTEGTGGTVYMLYARATPDISSSTEPVWPDRFHRILGYDVAKQWFYQNAGEREFNWSTEMASEAQALKNAMIVWDERIKTMAANSAGAPVDTSTTPYII